MSLKTDLRADLILLLTAFIWGLAFVYQRSGMDHIGPITFTFGRFLLMRSVTGQSRWEAPLTLY